MPLNRTYREDGLIKACLATEITFYLYSDDGKPPDCSRAYDVIAPELQPHVRWYRTDQMHKDHPIDADAVAMVPFWCSSSDDPRHEYGMHFSSGETSDDVRPWGFDFWIVEHQPKRFAGYFHITLPFEQALEEPEHVAALVGAIADVLPFRSGHAGFGLQLDEGEGSEERDRWARAWCRRNLAVSARDLIGSVGALTHGIRNVSWITLVDQELLSQLGPVDQVEQRLGSEVVTEKRGLGFLIRAGRAPRLGDVNRGEDVDLYRRVNDALRPIRIEDHPPFPGFSEEDTSEWLERLDQP
jgi:Protein of unknown function (DUF3396)